MGDLHDVCPELCRKAAAGDALHGRIIVIADPDAANISRREADKPRIAGFLAGAGLAGNRPVWNAGAAACAEGGIDDAHHHGVHLGG